MSRVHAQGITLDFDASLGILERFEVTDAGRAIAPLHRAPWVGTDEAMPEDAAPHMRNLGGDFFCAPFAATDDGSALHGWPPNSAWDTQVQGGTLTATLRRKVKGAALTKELRLIDGHPFVYQRHVFTGGAGRVTASNHANISVLSGAIIRTSPKARWETPANQQETDPARGRSGLVYPAQSADPAAFPGVDGPVDLTRYPWNPAHEDFVIGVEAAGHDLGWTAVTRPEQGDLYLSLRNAHEVPMTMLWHSNGGRDFAPWSGRHFGCLGVEEGAAEHMLSTTPPGDLTGPGAVALGGTTGMRHVIGAIDWPRGEPVAEVRLDGDALRVTGEGGARRTVPIDGDFLTG